MALLKLNESVEKGVGGDWRKVVHVLWMDRETKICNCGRELIQINLLSDEFSNSAEPRSSPNPLGKEELKKRNEDRLFYCNFHLRCSAHLNPPLKTKAENNLPSGTIKQTIKEKGETRPRNEGFNMGKTRKKKGTKVIFSK